MNTMNASQTISAIEAIIAGRTFTMNETVEHGFTIEAVDGTSIYMAEFVSDELAGMMAVNYEGHDGSYFSGIIQDEELVFAARRIISSFA